MRLRPAPCFAQVKEAEAFIRGRFGPRLDAKNTPYEVLTEGTRKATGLLQCKQGRAGRRAGGRAGVFFPPFAWP